MRNKLQNKNLSLLKDKFKLLCEYDFYTGDKDLILGSKMTEEEEEKDTEKDLEVDDENKDIDAELDSVASDLGVDDNETPDSNNQSTGEPQQNTPTDSPNQPPTPTPPPVDDSIELDVTELVNSNNEVKKIADDSNKKASDLLNKFTELIQKVDKVDRLSKKIEDLEKEVIKRTPTPVEKMEMRSLNSFPYSLKLTDFWSEKEGQYDVMNNKKDEFILTQDDVDRTYSESEIKKSFDVGYEEEDM